MPYTPQRFYSGAVSAVGNTTLYTVPAGQTAIIKEWSFGQLDTIDYHLYLGKIDGSSTDLALASSRLRGQFDLDQFHGHYVLVAGQSVVLGKNRVGTGYANIYGLLGAGALPGGKTPARLLCTATNGAAKTATGGGFIVKTIVACNTGDAETDYAVRHNSAPVSPWPWDRLAPRETKQWDHALFYRPGDTLTVNISGAVHVGVYGYQL